MQPNLRQYLGVGFDSYKISREEESLCNLTKQEEEVKHLK
jgi:hypothetical protein